MAKNGAETSALRSFVRKDQGIGLWLSQVGSKGGGQINRGSFRLDMMGYWGWGVPRKSNKIQENYHRLECQTVNYLKNRGTRSKRMPITAEKQNRHRKGSREVGQEKNRESETQQNNIKRGIGEFTTPTAKGRPRWRGVDFKGKRCKKKPEKGHDPQKRSVSGGIR